jgi:hypothetical protein
MTSESSTLPAISTTPQTEEAPPILSVKDGKIQVQIPIDELRQRSLFVGVPMYGGMCTGMFARSIADLSAICTQYGVRLQFYFMFNESLIPRARNYVADEFLRSTCSHMMFIDADIGFEAQDIIAMLALQSDDSEYDIISGVYPKKCIAWEKIKYAVDKGKADKNPNDLEKYVGDYVVNFIEGTTQISMHQPAQVLEVGTGFMMIRRKTFEAFKTRFPEYSYKPDHVRTENFDGSREITMFFQSEIDPKGTKRYLSEDYWFCQRIQEINLKTWICPWIALKHVGTYVFGGSLMDIAALGASPTASVDALQITKQK